MLDKIDKAINELESRGYEISGIGMSKNIFDKLPQSDLLTFKSCDNLTFELAFYNDIPIIISENFMEEDCKIIVENDL